MVRFSVLKTSFGNRAFISASPKTSWPKSCSGETSLKFTEGDLKSMASAMASSRAPLSDMMKSLSRLEVPQRGRTRGRSLRRRMLPECFLLQHGKGFLAFGGRGGKKDPARARLRLKA